MKKKLLLLGMVFALTLVWVTPVQAEAECGKWIKQRETTYCATPVCTMAIPSQFTETSYINICGSFIDYKVEKEVHGCCDHL